MGISVRNMLQEDLELILKWRTDPDITKYMKTDFEATIATQRKWYERIQEDASKKYWIIEINDIPAGVVCLTDIDYDAKTCEWGYYVGEKNLRSFAAAISIECSLYDYVFEGMGFREIFCECLSFNTGVIKLHEYCGNHINKIEKNAVLKKEASYDLVIMSIRAGEWKEKRKDFSYDSISFLP